MSIAETTGRKSRLEPTAALCDRVSILNRPGVCCAPERSRFALRGLSFWERHLPWALPRIQQAIAESKWRRGEGGRRAIGHGPPTCDELRVGLLSPTAARQIVRLARTRPPARKTVAPAMPPSPASFPFPDTLHRTLARVRAKPLQRRPPRTPEALIAAGPAARAIEKTS